MATAALELVEAEPFSVEHEASAAGLAASSDEEAAVLAASFAAVAGHLGAFAAERDRLGSLGFVFSCLLGGFCVLGSRSNSSAERSAR